MEDIFAQLPGKYVVRCRCLSRAWAATFTSDDFVDLHLCLANSQGIPRILLLQVWRSRRTSTRRAYDYMVTGSTC
jgi:hypothetical protein